MPDSDTSWLPRRHPGATNDPPVIATPGGVGSLIVTTTLRMARIPNCWERGHPLEVKQTTFARIQEVFRAMSVYV